MNRNVLIEYKGNCPSCGKLQVSGKPDEVDVLCWKCQAQEGKIMYIRDAEYGDSDSIEISIETPEMIYIIQSYVPQIKCIKKEE